MKKIIIFISLSLIITSCGHVGLKLDENKNIGFGVAGGVVTPERGLDILEKQSKIETKILLQKEMQEAIRRKDFEAVKKINQLIKDLNYNESSPLPKVCIKNNSSYPIQILNGPFEGTTIRSMSQTPSKPFTLGMYEMQYKTYGKQKTWLGNLNLFISPETTEITLRNN